MKKFNLKNFALLTAMLATVSLAQAQPRMGAWPAPGGTGQSNWYKDYLGLQMSITSPSNISGPVVYTIANDGGGGANEWGGAITSPITNANVIQADPYEACNTLTNAAAISGNIALIKRGNCEFGAKAFQAQQAGATACIIVNNVTGGPVGMGPGAQGANVTIPVIMISDVDGQNIVNALNNGPVTISFSIWGRGNTHDLSIVTGGMSLWHNYAIPLNQLQSGAPDEYRGITCGVLANLGSSTETNVKLKSTVTFTPNGGSASVVHTDSVVVSAGFAPGDSIITPFVDDPYSLPNINSVGKYDVTYEVSSDDADDFPGDNTMTYSFYVTDGLYSKSRYNFVDNVPVSNIGYAFANSTDFLWGPLYYVQNGGYQIQRAQFAISISGGGDMSNQGAVNILVWRFKDSTNISPTLNGIIESGECKLVGAGTKTYVQGDSSGDFFTVDIYDINDGVSPIATESGYSYWVTASVPINTFLGCDGQLNYFPRSWANAKATDSTYDIYTPIYNGTEGVFSQTITEFAISYPFEGFLFVDSVRFAQQNSGTVPSISMITSPFPISVKNVENTNNMNVSLFPNPATDVMNVDLSLDYTADKVSYVIIDAMGRRISEDIHNNVKTDNYAVNTKTLATGNYYLVIGTNESTVVKQFSVIR